MEVIFVARQTTQRGGQASLGLFGISGSDHPHRAAVKGNGNGAKKTDDRPRIVNGLTFSQRRSVICSRVDLAAVSLGAYERRPVPAGSSMESLIAAAHARKAAHNDEEAVPKATPATPAMLAVARASDMREAFPHHADDEEADFAHCSAGVGYVEHLMALEG